MTARSYTVDSNSVQINPDLSDELFDIQITPGDQVVDMDMGIELRGPGKAAADYLLSLGDDDMRNEVTLEQPKSKTLDLCEGIKLDLTHIPPGSFVMGSPVDEKGYPDLLLKRYRRAGRKESRPENERPREVNITEGFYLGRFEVTCRQYRCYRPSFEVKRYENMQLDSPDQPVILTWEEAVEFCEWLSKRSGLVVRLPREAEWEYACRAGNQSRFFWGDDESVAGEYANLADQTYEKRFPRRSYTFRAKDGEVISCAVGKFKPNSFGLYDMIGNVPEWCEDIYTEDLQDAHDEETPDAPEGRSEERVYRGGGWSSDIIAGRCASRRGMGQNDRNIHIGFRVLVQE